MDAADINNDGWQDLFVANVDQEMFSVYQNSKNESFRDVSHVHAVAQSTRLLSGWGLKYFDYDNDGAIDLFLANGHPDDMIDKYSETSPLPRTAAVVSSGAQREADQRQRHRRTGLSEIIFSARVAVGRLQQRWSGGRSDGR